MTKRQHQWRLWTCACALSLVTAGLVLGDDAKPTPAPGPVAGAGPGKPVPAKPGAPSDPQPDDEVADAVNLRPTLVEGRVSRFEVWTHREQNALLAVEGRTEQQNSSFDVKGEVTWKIDKVSADGSASCTMTLDWLNAKIARPDGTVVECDSRRATGGDEGVQKVLRSMGGVPVKINVSADGTVTAATGVDAVRRKAGVGVEVPDELDYVETASDLALLPMAPKEAAAKTSWSVPSLWNHELGKLRYDTKWTLDGVEEIADIPVATVSAESKVKLEPDPSKIRSVARRSGRTQQRSDHPDRGEDSCA